MMHDGEKTSFAFAFAFAFEVGVDDDLDSRLLFYFSSYLFVFVFAVDVMGTNFFLATINGKERFLAVCGVGMLEHAGLTHFTFWRIAIFRITFKFYSFFTRSYNCLNRATKAASRQHQ